MDQNVEKYQKIIDWSRATSQEASDICVVSRIKLTYADAGLYTDESPGLKVDPVVVLVLSLGFIFSVVALHSTLPSHVS